MAIDATMLTFGSAMEEAMVRVYGWTEPAITFGYSQKWDWVANNIAPFEGARVRRLTGGGIVDHRNDMTYALSLPPQHPFHRKPAQSIYREVHELIASVLMENGIPAELAPCLKSCDESPSLPSGVCFQAAEPYDVIQPSSGVKIAGAAMKRNQDGVLIQGSLNTVLTPGMDRVSFERDLVPAVSGWLELPVVGLKGTLPADTLLKERERFRSEDWNQRR